MPRRKTRYAEYYDQRWPAYVSVAERRAKAKRELASRTKTGKKPNPVVIEGRRIAGTFWGRAWCDNLEAYSDYANRLPRGRSYVRNGSVIDLEIETGKVTALVCGSEVYKVTVSVKPQRKPAWKAIAAQCTGQIGSLIELLQGKLSQPVMEVVTRAKTGLFPAPEEISFRCSCPDGAWMCKHVAAALYGVGNRLDHEPALLFRLRHVDPEDLIRDAGRPPAADVAAPDVALAGTDLAALFGIEMAAAAEPRAVAAKPAGGNKRPPRRHAKLSEATG